MEDEDAQQKNFTLFFKS